MITAHGRFLTLALKLRGRSPCPSLARRRWAGGRPEPARLVARKRRPGRLLRLWRDDLLALPHRDWQRARAGSVVAGARNTLHLLTSATAMRQGLRYMRPAGPGS